MKNWILAVLIFKIASAGVVSVSVEIAPGDVKLTEREGGTVVELSLNQPGMAVISTTEPGEPLLPVISGNVLIPADARLVGVRVMSVEWREIVEAVRVYPVQPMRPISRFNSVPFVEPKPEVYNSDADYPPLALTPVPVGSKSGFKIAGFLFCPFKYLPKSQRLFFATKAVIAVEYQEKSAPAPTITPGQLTLFGEDVARLVINHKDVKHWTPVVTGFDGEELDVVIVTSSSLAPALTNFRNYLQEKGYFTEIIPTETIYARYSGRDNPEKIRNMLKEKFSKQGLKYAILAGDVQYVPCRYGYLPYDPYNVPADLYYSDLDGTWDRNNNGIFGEYYYYAHNPDSVDLYSDIIVGRLPFDDAGNCANFLHKDTLYERHPDTTYLRNILLPFEDLWYYIDYYGRIVNKNIALALSQMGTWLVDSMLDMPPSQCVTSINQGRHFFHYAGHGAYNAFGGTFSIYDLPNLNNTSKPTVVNSMACDCGYFDDEYDCLGEEFLNLTNGGAVSTCLNARYGWGAPPTMGPSENLCMEFYNNYVKGLNQGRAYALAKDFYRNAAFSQMTYRWSVYDWTLQGDPTMLFWRAKPKPLTVAYPETISATPQVITVEVRYPNSLPASNARVAILHQNELIARGITNSSGSAKIPLSVIGDTWTLRISVTAPDGAPYRSFIFTRSGSTNPVVVYHCHWIDDANGRLDPGEEVNLYLVVKNQGNLNSVNTSGYLRSNSSYLTILDSISNYGLVAAGDTSRGDAYRVRVNPNCPQGERAEMVLKVISNAGVWESQFELTIGTPHPRNGIWAIHDTGDFIIGVCANGGIGTTTWRGQGLGFIYPKSRSWSSSVMMHGSFLLGVNYPDTNWVADNYYGVPWQVTAQDFAVIESLQPIIPAQLGNQQYECLFSDINSPQPKAITVKQRSFVSASPKHKDFIILEYQLRNNSSDTIKNLWAGVACDFRTAPWNSDDNIDYAGTDSTRILAYVKAYPETLALGVRAIYPRETGGWANCINHNSYINDGFTKGEKMRFLDGRLRATTGTYMSNWHALVSSGPYTIPPDDSQIVAFAICGGRTVAQMTASSDTAANWFEPPTAITQDETRFRSTFSIDVKPRLFSNKVAVSYYLSQIAPLNVTIYDPLGRVRERFEVLPANRSGTFTWGPKSNQQGVFIIHINGEAEKVIHIR